MKAQVSRLELGIFLVSFAVLLIELLLTRIFSVTMFYHLSFLVVSLAMLGFGGSGLLVNLWPSRFPPDRLFTQTARAALLFGVSSVLAIGISFRLPISLESSTANWLRIGLTYLMCSIPFFFGGLVVSLILAHRTAQANRLYFADLLGAACGCVALIPATNLLGAPSAVLFGAALAAVATLVLAPPSDTRLRGAAGLMVGLLVLAVFANARLHSYDVKFVKGQPQPPTLALKWNSFSRVDVVGTPRTLWLARPLDFPGFSTRLDPDFAIPEVGLRYDADAATQITYFDGDLRRMEFLHFDVTSSPHHLRPFHEVLVIGPGGGRDVLTALSFGSGPVTGVEINPMTVALMRTRFRTFTHDLYNGYPGVNIVVDDGRSFLRHGDHRYDLIEASLVDTWAASSAGAYALTENSLYTVDAFVDYLDHLTPDGVVCFNRWFQSPPIESLRVVVLAREALERRGVKDPAAHVLVVRTNSDETARPSLGSIMIKASPFTADEIARMRAYGEEMGFLLPYYPGLTGNDFAALLGPRSAEMIAGYPFDLSTVSDERPFFFSRVPIVPRLLNQLGLSRSRLGSMPLDLGGRTLLGAVIATALTTALLLLAPALANRRRKGRAGPAIPPHRGALWAGYFACLGLGFILIEIVFIQRFSLFLGYPVYSLSVVLFTMLLSSALGSLMAGRFSSRRALPGMLAILVAVLFVYALALPVALASARGAGIVARILISVAVIAPLGFVMGMPFPSGIRRAGQESKELVSWAWAVNGGASVFGSTLCVLISMAQGFTASFIVGTVVYLVALVMLVWLGEARVPSREEGAR